MQRIVLTNVTCFNQKACKQEYPIPTSREEKISQAKVPRGVELRTTAVACNGTKFHSAKPVSVSKRVRGIPIEETNVTRQDTIG